VQGNAREEEDTMSQAHVQWEVFIRRIWVVGLVVSLLGGIALWAPAAAWAQAKKEVVIGCTLPLTGAFSAFGRYFVDVFKFWEEEVNGKGGLLGSNVRLIIYDDKSDASTSVSLYHKLITVDKVDLLVGGFPTPVVLPVMPVAEKYKMLFVQGGANAKNLIIKGNYKYTFSTLTSDTVWTDPLWDWLASLPAEKRPKRAAFVQQVNPFLQGVVASATPRAQPLGIEVTTVETYASDAQDFTAILQKFKAADVDLVFGSNNYPAGLSFLRTIAELQYRPKLIYMTVGPTVPAWIKDLGARTDYVFTSTNYWHTLSVGGNERFVKAIEAKYKYTPPREAGMAYTPLQVIQAAVEATKSLDQDTLRDYISSHEFGTVSGKMKFDAHGLGVSRNYLIQVQKAKQELVYPRDFRTSEVVYPRP
jgi:branched-chain amino acid transport system substrate-binding protein